MQPSPPANNIKKQKRFQWCQKCRCWWVVFQVLRILGCFVLIFVCSANFLAWFIGRDFFCETVLEGILQRRRWGGEEMSPRKQKPKQKPKQRPPRLCVLGFWVFARYLLLVQDAWALFLPFLTRNPKVCIVFHDIGQDGTCTDRGLEHRVWKERKKERARESEGEQQQNKTWNKTQSNKLKARTHHHCHHHNNTYAPPRYTMCLRCGGSSICNLNFFKRLSSPFKTFFKYNERMSFSKRDGKPGYMVDPPDKTMCL